MSSHSEHLLLGTIFQSDQVAPDGTVNFQGPLLCDANPGVLTYSRVDIGDIRSSFAALVVRPDSLGAPGLWLFA
jgi:hypothetical protein